jgi:hypothetical protein
MVDPKELELHINASNMDFSAALNVYRNLCASNNTLSASQENAYLSPPLFSFPLLLQQLASNTVTAASSALVSPTSIQPSQPTSTPSTLKTASSFDSNTGTNSKFHGRHSIWRHFRVLREENVYRCQVGECSAAYTWPPSTSEF